MRDTRGYASFARTPSDKINVKTLLFSVKALKKASFPMEDEDLANKVWDLWWEENNRSAQNCDAAILSCFYVLGQDKWLTAFQGWFARIKEAGKDLAAPYNTPEKCFDQYIRAHLLLFGEAPVYAKKFH